MDVKSCRVTIALVNYQTIEKEAPKRDRLCKGFCETRASEGCKTKIKVPVKMKRQEGEHAKERRKNVTKF